MGVILTGSGHVMLVAPGKPALWAPIGSSADSNSQAADPYGISGLSGWWDASTLDGLLSPIGGPVTAFGAPVGSLADKSLAGAPLTVWHQSGSAAAPVATPRLNGHFGGLGRNTIIPPDVPATGQSLPVMDPDQGLLSAPLPMGSGTSWTRCLVWSRPNWRGASTGASTLLSVNGVVVLAADNQAGSNRLVLFPGAQQTILATGLTRRHTHVIVLRQTAGSGIDVWLDGAQVAAGAANPLGASVTAPLLFLHDGSTRGGAECWFHEAASWERALSAGEISALLHYLGRWQCGPRQSVQILMTGQSNCGNGFNDGAWHLLAQGVAWHLGALAYGVVGSYGSPPAATAIHGEGLYDVPALGLTGSFLQRQTDGTNPGAWPLGTDGLAVQTWLQSHTDPADAADIVAIFWPWSEDDSTRTYTEKSTYRAAARRFLALERGMLQRSAASLPQVWWSAIPFAYGGNDAGMQMQREVVAEMAADATQNVSVVLPQTADSLPRAPVSYDPGTGLWSGGDSLHRDATDLQRFGRLAAPLVARAVLASRGGDTIDRIPDGIPTAGGPRIAQVYRQSATVLVVTVQHDAGTDLIVPQTQAMHGAGWAVMDGGSVAMPGRIVTATACTRLSSTQLQVTLAQPLSNASAYCRLFYPYGAATIGRGNAVTDNLASVEPPAGWDIGGDLGSEWRTNMPLQAPMTVANGVAASGIVLSDAP